VRIFSFLFFSLVISFVTYFLGNNLFEHKFFDQIVKSYHLILINEQFKDNLMEAKEGQVFALSSIQKIISLNAN
jgi:hypothetical protein